MHDIFISDLIAISFSAPNFFNDAWLAKIKFDVSGNWRLKVRTYLSLWVSYFRLSLNFSWENLFILRKEKPLLLTWEYCDFQVSNLKKVLKGILDYYSEVSVFWLNRNLCTNSLVSGFPITTEAVRYNFFLVLYSILFTVRNII